jgi:MFS family permease
LLVGAGLAFAAAARTIVEVYVAYGLGVGLGVGCSYVPVVGAVQRWFVKRRGFASGLAVSGIGVGTLVMPPFASHLIESVGWREAYVVLATVAVTLGVGMSLFIANDPAARNLAPDGNAVAPNAPASAPSGTSLRDAVRTRQFVSLYAACLICSFAVFVPFVHLVPYAVDNQVPQSSAVLLLGVIGVGSTMGRFFLGGLADRIGRQSFVLAMYIGMAASLAIWAAASGFWLLAAFALLFGLFYGGWVAILPALVMDYFGGRSVSGIIGVLYTSVGFGALVGPSAAGFAFDLSHSYLAPILMSVGVNVLAAVITARRSD